MELKKTEDSNSIAENIEFDSAGNLTSVNYHDAKVCPIEESRATSPLCGFFYCQICKLLLTVPLNPSRLAVPIKTPPSDKCFYRCVCNCLLLISRLQNVFFCPRRSCHSVLITEYAKRHPKLISNFIQKHAKELKRFASLPNISALNENSQIGAKGLFRSPPIILLIFELFLPFLADWSTVLIRCGYCKKIFKAKPYLDLSAEIVCPKCENVSALTPRYPRRVCRSYILYGLLTILVSSAVSSLSTINATLMGCEDLCTHAELVRYMIGSKTTLSRIFKNIWDSLGQP
ncbi:hypothetical protein ACTXT7_011186 [Hymenolepis weldensis]